MAFSHCTGNFVVVEKQKPRTTHFLHHGSRLIRIYSLLQNKIELQFECFDMAVFIGITWVPESCIGKDIIKL